MMNRTWIFRYANDAERQEMVDAVQELAASDRNVRLGVRHPPGGLQILGDTDGVFLAKIARPIRSF